MFRIKLNNPIEEFCLGIYSHQIEKITINEKTQEEIDKEEANRLIIGFLIISIEIIW